MNPVPSIPQAELPPSRATSSSLEAGFMLITVVVLCALVLIALAVAAPVIAKDLRRDKELESEHRAQQYVRAIRLYYKKIGSYPPSIDALKKTNNIRFLRQEYVDPLTGKADWKLIHQGEQKTTVKGFFGQELGGLSSGGLGSAAGMNSGTGTAIGGSTVALSAGFSGIGSSGSSSSSTSVSGASGSTGSSSFGASGASGSSGALGGGGPIVGVASARTGNSILTPNQQSTYESWEFWYDPRIEQLYQKGQQNAGVGSGGMGSQPASAFGATGSTGGIGGGLGTGFGSSSFGSGSTGMNGNTGTNGATGSTGASGNTGVSQ
ncbi:MAG: hypothetical protein ACRYFU_09640 [Janthinobacterium lividum]